VPHPTSLTANAGASATPHEQHMSAADEFDAFYKGVRSRLLLQTYALTGDLPAARSAVRDSFIVAWHHWRTVSRQPDPEAWVRPHAWAQAQRRHTARIWHRDKKLDREARATLDALGKLPLAQRKMLLLAHLASSSMDAMAEEAGLPPAEAEKKLQLATARFSVQRNVPTTSIRAMLEALRVPVESASWPRPTILRRAGAARRRTHTLIGVAAVVAAVVVSGTLVTDLDGVRATLDREPFSPAPAGAGASASAAGAASLPEPKEFSGADLLSENQVDDHVRGQRWQERRTTDNAEGDGLVLPCQQSRYADPRGLGALLRTFDTSPRKGGEPSSAYQLTEISRSARSARRTYDTTLEWYAGCTDRRLQLLATRRVTHVGDDARLLVLRSWSGHRPTIVVGVTRSGSITTTTLTLTPSHAAPGLGRAARLAAAAVNGLCARPEAGECASRPQVKASAPVPVGVAPGMLAEVDLPPVSRVSRPWVGTEPRRADVNVAATGCDNTVFTGKQISNGLTRSFLIPGAKLPVAFGITETVGTLRSDRARAFVNDVRRKLGECPDRDRGLGTEVTRLAHRHSRARDITVWRLTTELDDRHSVTYLMGIVREGSAVGQVGFVPEAGVTMGRRDFVSLVERAGERLPAMPPPR
jgi:DNA-directed RNA polymerase specialized sigma24 family protein